MSAETVPLPTAVGPARTVRRAGRGGAVSSRGEDTGAGGVAEMSAKPLDERGRLVGTQPAHAACLGDPDLLHDRPGLHLTDTGHGLQECDHLELADHLVLAPPLDHLGERALRVLQTVLDLSAHPAGL